LPSPPPICMSHGISMAPALAPKLPHMLPHPPAAAVARPPISPMNAHTAGLARSVQRDTSAQQPTRAHVDSTNGQHAYAEAHTTIELTMGRRLPHLRPNRRVAQSQ
jgi:hypothetical protein